MPPIDSVEPSVDAAPVESVKVNLINDPPYASADAEALNGVKTIVEADPPVVTANAVEMSLVEYAYRFEPAEDVFTDFFSSNSPKVKSSRLTLVLTEA